MLCLVKGMWTPKHHIHMGDTKWFTRSWLRGYLLGIVVGQGDIPNLHTFVFPEVMFGYFTILL